MTNPRIYLTVDNCYAYKRWTNVRDWMQKSVDCGYRYIEASADTEADPLYMGMDYMRSWTDEINNLSEETGANVKNLYSGHGTYTTLGLSHPDKRVSERFINDWFNPMVDMAARVNAGLGFYAHGFMQPEIQTPAEYSRKVSELYESLARIAAHAKEAGVKYVSVENMYTPHMYPWTLKSAEDTLRKVYEIAKYPMYLTVDVGHMAGQQRFMKPSRYEIIGAAGTYGKLWVGTEKAHELLRKGDVNGVIDDIEKNPQLFADSHADSDPYAWLEKFGCYSPIIHLQQTDNKASAHRPFTREYNENGIIKADKVIRAIKKSYEQPDIEGMPPKCEEICLTVEVFCGTMDSPYMLLDNLSKSAEYFRRVLPRDGMTLSELMPE